jgi:hypothetical protein
MTKRKRSSEAAENLDSVFNLIFTAINKTDDSIPKGTATWLKKLKRQLLSDLSGGNEVRKAAKEFTMDEAVEAFGLTYTRVRSQSAQKHFWKIEELPETKGFELTPCISKTFSQSS